MEARLLKHSKPGSSEFVAMATHTSSRRKFNVSLKLCSVKAIPLLTIVSTKGEKVSSLSSSIVTHKGSDVELVNRKRKSNHV